MEVLLALIVVVGATAAMLYLGRVAEKSPFALSELHYINWQLKYQVSLLGVAASVLAAAYLLNSANFAAFVALGRFAAPVESVSWLPIPTGASWLVLGAGLSFFITVGTSTFVYLQFRKTVGGFGALLRFMPWVLLLSATNAFSEEVIYRLGIVVPLFGTIQTAYILLVSAIAFGAPHLRGMPNGIIGALMAGFLGWFLAKSVVDTHGMFWAWFIHFLQDVVIFSAFVMAAVKRRFNPALGEVPGR